jgi:uncharacterized protein (TIGR01777 family)
MEKVLIVGGSGMVGNQLQKKLINRGYSVAILGRAKHKLPEVKSYIWDIKQKTIDEEAIKTADYIVNLAGAGIADARWTDSRKETILSSRVDSTTLLIQTLIKTNSKPKAYISASAVGYYGAITSQKIYTEEDLPSADFLSTTCQSWENSSNPILDLKIRRVLIRIGVVLSNKGGALAKLKIPFKFGLGSAVASGQQYIPWIHIDDLCESFIKAIEDSKMNGIYNAVAPNPETNKSFSSILAKVLNKPFWMPNVPQFVLQLLMGEMSVIITKGSQVSCKKLLATGFHFKYPTLTEALNNLVANNEN